MPITLLWLRANDSPPPDSIPKSWNILHKPIVRIKELINQPIPNHKSILFTSSRSPIIISKRTQTRAPVLCVGAFTMTVANRLGWNNSLLLSESSKTLQKLLISTKIPSPLLYAHGNPISVDINTLLSRYNGQKISYCCYKQVPIIENWRKVILSIASDTKVLVPILSFNTATLWREFTKDISFDKLEMKYFCFSTNIASALGNLRDNMMVHIVKKPKMSLLIDTMITETI